MDDMKDRIRMIMESQHMTQQTFANFIGMSPASLSSIFNNRTKPTLTTVEAIMGRIPTLNIDWLLFGRGSMFADTSASSERTAGNDEKNGGEADAESAAYSPDLFAAQPERNVTADRSRQAVAPVRAEVKFVERPQRQITEIRVYFDDQTYESFVPKK